LHKRKTEGDAGPTYQNVIKQAIVMSLKKKMTGLFEVRDEMVLIDKHIHGILEKG